MCNLLTKSIVWAAHNYLPNSTLILVTYSSEKQGRKFWFDFSIQHIYFQFENSQSFNIFLVTKGELGKKIKKKSKHSPAGKDLFEKLLWPESKFYFILLMWSEDGRISSLHSSYTEIWRRTKVFLLTNYLGLGECILFLGLHYVYPGWLVPPRQKSQYVLQHLNFCSGMFCFDCDLFWLFCLDPNFISCVCSPSCLSDITKIPCSPETLFLSLANIQTTLCALHRATASTV